MALGEDVPLEPLEPADHLVEQPADLGEVAADRQHLGAEPFVHCALIFSGRLTSSSAAAAASASIWMRARSSAASSSAGAIAPVAASAIRALRPFECLLVHGGKATLAVGWTPPSSTTSCRRS